MKSFKSFTKRMPKNSKAEDVYDDHVDELMHHLNRARELVSKESLLHKAGSRIGVDTSHFHDIHGHLLNILKKV